MNESRAGIYRIIIARGAMLPKAYVGQASVIRERKRRHFNALRRGTHANRGLQKDFIEFGEAAVSFEVVLICEKSKDILSMYEQLVLDSYPRDMAYNVHRECIDTPLGTRRTPEAKAKMAAAHRGKPLSSEHKAAIGAAFKGKTCGPRSLEARANMSEAARTRKGRVVSQETRRKLAESRKHIVVTAETRAKQSASQKRRFARVISPPPGD